MKLILMRHAKSSWDNPGHDYDRPLNDRGFRSARALGDWLRAQGHVPNLALVSGAKRTQQTWEGLALQRTELRLSRRLYLSPPTIIFAQAKDVAADCVLVIAHNPGIAMAAEQIVKVAPDHPRFEDYPTGATLVVETDLTPGSGRVLDFVIPREL